MEKIKIEKRKSVFFVLKPFWTQARLSSWIKDFEEGAPEARGRRQARDLGIRIQTRDAARPARPQRFFKAPPGGRGQEAA